MTDCTRTQRLGPQQLGVVQRVGDRLPRDAGLVGDRGERRAGTAVARPLRVGPAARTGSCDLPGLLIVPMLDVTGTCEHVVPRICRSARLACGPWRKRPRRPPDATYHCSECGWETGEVGGPLRRVPGLGHGRGAGRSAEPGAGRSGHRAGPPDRRGADRGLPRPHQRRARARPGARRRPGPRGGDPARRRARRRQVHAAARGGRPDRPPAPPGALRHRRGVGRPGADARPTAPAAIQDELYLAAETDLGAVLGHVEEVKPTLLVIDSVQTISAGDVDGVPGGVTQVKEVSAALIRMAKLRNITLVIIGHVTKDGTIAGPRVLEHLVDVVLQFEGERTSRLRMVRAVKNRYGPVDEVGCFDLSAEGIVAITDPTGLFLDTRHGPVPGTCVAVALEGRRPLLSEVQALVTHTAGRATAAYDVRGRLRPRRDDPRRAPAARRHPAAQPRRVRLQRRRRPADRAEQRRRHRAGHRLGLAGPATRPQRGGHRRARPLRRAAPGPRHRRPARRGRPDGLPLRARPRRHAPRPRAEPGARRHAGGRRRPHRAGAEPAGAGEGPTTQPVQALLH